VESRDIKFKTNLVIISLASCFASIGPPSIASALLLIDVAESFKTHIGIMSQMNTASALFGIITALVLGSLSVFFDHKNLLIIGLLMIFAGMCGSSLAPNLIIMILSYALTGGGIAIVTSMSNTIVADLFRLRDRATIIGKIFSGRSLANLFGTPLIGLLAGYGGWRLGFSGFIIPLCLATIVLVYLFIPRVVQNPSSSSDFTVGFREIYAHKNAVGSIIGSLFATSATSILFVFNASYLRQTFGISTNVVSILMAVNGIFLTFGSLTSGKLCTIWGVKKVVIGLTTILGFFFSLYLSGFLDIYMTALLGFVSSCLTGVRIASSSSLNLEQIPTHKGTIMAVTTAGDNLGTILGTSLSGLILLKSGFNQISVLIIILMMFSIFMYKTLKN
jgi:DHA1 family arabinose polymer transporter-like MFS transporter